MDRGFYRCSMMFKDFHFLFFFPLTVWQKRGSVEICFWRYRSITRTIDFLLALVLIAISKPPYNIGTIEHTSLPFSSSLCFCLLPTVDLLETCVSLSTVDSLGSSLSTEKSIKQFIVLLVTQPVPKPSFHSHCFNSPRRFQGPVE